MAAAAGNIINKYQSVAPKHVVNAVANASRKTGVDFAFLMEKASAESNFNPTAKAKTSSATGLYQFIESTWLSMVKRYGDKHGLGEYAEKIDMKNGRACMEDCAEKEEILNLRNDPKIAALMAGEFTAENKNHLERNVKGDIGSTEMYFAHFMGAGGAAKFLNSRNTNPDAIAANLFPAAAKANKNVFYDSKTGHARTLDEVYKFFDKKFDGNGSPAARSPAPGKTTTAAPAVAQAAVKAPAAPLPALTLREVVAQALPLFDDANEADDIIWNDDPRFFGVAAAAKEPRTGFQRLSSDTLLMLAEMKTPRAMDSTDGKRQAPKSHWYNS